MLLWGRRRCSLIAEEGYRLLFSSVVFFWLWVCFVLCAIPCVCVPVWHMFSSDVLCERWSCSVRDSLLYHSVPHQRHLYAIFLFCQQLNRPLPLHPIVHAETMFRVVNTFLGMFSTQAAVRERTQAVEKLALAEAEAGRLRVELSSVSATSEETRASSSHKSSDLGNRKSQGCRGISRCLALPIRCDHGASSIHSSGARPARDTRSVNVKCITKRNRETDPPLPPAWLFWKPHPA